MDPLSGISSVATGGCAIPWCGVLAGRSIGARSSTSVPARSSRNMRAPCASAADAGAGKSPVATTRMRVNSNRWVMSGRIVTTRQGAGQRTYDDRGLLLVDEVPCPGHAVHDEQRERGGQDRYFLRADPALVCRRSEEQADRAPHLGEMWLQPLRLAPLRHCEERLERPVQVARGGRRVTVHHHLAHPG